jgi:hypothetical protein
MSLYKHVFVCEGCQKNKLCELIDLDGISTPFMEPDLCPYGHKCVDWKHSSTSKHKEHNAVKPSGSSEPKGSSGGAT